jgi:hypothetical protein
VSPTGPSRVASSLGPGGIAAVAVFAVAMVVYLRTLLPGPSVGDWAEMQFIPAELGIPHPTGYPLYVLVGKAFSLLPIGSLGFRAELLSAVAAAAAAGTSVLIAVRLGVRPLIAAAAGLSLAVTGTLWLEATYSEMNGLHLLLVAAVIHRALVWRAERRDRDLRLGGLLAGLAVANHLLALTVIPFIVLFVIVDARPRLIERPVLLVQTAMLALVGVSLYLFIPLRALAGPPSIYGQFLNWDGFWAFVSGAEFRGDMHFASIESIGRVWHAIPDVVAQLVARSNVVFVGFGLVGAAIELFRDRWAGLLLGVVAASSVYFYANYLGDLDQYLLAAWLVLAVCLAVAAETVIAWLERRIPRLAETRIPAVLLMLLPIVIVANNWTTYDQSGNHEGEQFAQTVFADLPHGAVLLTYWDALTNLSYVHCIEGERPDLSLRAYDVAARVVCDPITGTLDEVARQRPLFALFAVDSELDRVRGSFDLIAGPRLALPYGRRSLDHAGILYQLVPKDAATAPIGGADDDR